MASRRERYESANIRGGLGVRKRLSEESFRPTYRLNGVQTGATVNECLDRFGRWEGGYRSGVLVRKTAHYVYVKWDDEDEVDMIDQGDARYKVDRDKWRITAPRVGNPLNPTGSDQSTRALSQNRGDPALTGQSGSGRIGASANAEHSTDRGDEEMAQKMSNAAAERAAAQKALEDGSLQERETYTAKQVATRCGTDAKTMRKFFRSNHSTVEPVGQGGRYEFAATDLPQIKREFDAWSGRGAKAKVTDADVEAAKTAIKSVAKKKTPMAKKSETGDRAPKEPVVFEEDTYYTDDDAKYTEQAKDIFGDDHEPTAEELEALAALDEVSDLDLDDLDSEEI